MYLGEKERRDCSGTCNAKKLHILNDSANEDCRTRKVENLPFNTDGCFDCRGPETPKNGDQAQYSPLVKQRQTDRVQETKSTQFR